MMQYIIVGIALALAISYALYRIVVAFARRNDKGGGRCADCTGCALRDLRSKEDCKGKL